MSSKEELVKKIVISLTQNVIDWHFVSKGYANKSEYIADVGNRNYSKDPSYRAMVSEKLAKSNKQNW